VTVLWHQSPVAPSEAREAVLAACSAAATAQVGRTGRTIERRRAGRTLHSREAGSRAGLVAPRLRGPACAGRASPRLSPALTPGQRRRRRRLGLRWSDIDFGNSTLTIRQALQRVGGRLALVEPKTVLSRRTVPVPPPTLAALRTHWTKQKTDQFAAGMARQD